MVKAVLTFLASLIPWGICVGAFSENRKRIILLKGLGSLSFVLAVMLGFIGSTKEPVVTEEYHVGFYDGYNEGVKEACQKFQDSLPANLYPLFQPEVCDGW